MPYHTSTVISVSGNTNALQFTALAPAQTRRQLINFYLMEIYCQTMDFYVNLTASPFVFVRICISLLFK